VISKSDAFENETVREGSKVQSSDLHQNPQQLINENIDQDACRDKIN
jgi:hypothetical protein